MTGRPVEDLQKMLRTIAKADKRIPTVLPNGIFDAETEAALRAVQRLNGLPETGVADLVTWDTVRRLYKELAPLVQPLEPLQLRWDPLQIISPGTSNTHLFLIQGMLRGLGEYYVNLPGVEVTGRYDEASVAAVRFLQRVSGLPEDGVIDQKTWFALSGLYRMTTGRGASEELVETRTVGD
ncbi:MAG: peptidoglycan-binding protein [Oscillospiraceae bacterium]|nr:peptidoglycan-binding protein [Oscillospiraceae bacterium]MBR2897987.1 peptidoglycan-binding protein [Oscillospiraceae bacterium]MBR2977027.1 peptidoglycan-binding protein [Oscillospiraceae bacterium]